MEFNLPYKAFPIACASKLNEELLNFSANAATKVRTLQLNGKSQQH